MISIYIDKKRGMISFVKIFIKEIAKIQILLQN